MGLEQTEGIGFQVVPYSDSGASLDKFYIVQFDMLGVDYGSFEESFAHEDIYVSSCAMWFCVNAYNVSTLVSKQSQTVTQNFHEGNTTAFQTGGDVLFSSLPPDMNPVANTTYSVANEAYYAFPETIQVLFKGTAFLNEGAFISRSDSIEAVWKASGDPDPWIQQVALSITDSIRAGSGGLQVSHTVYNGTAYQAVIIVCWYWILLPVAMVTLSLLFLAVVMIKTARSPVASWKGSPLIYLLIDVDAGIKELASGRTDVCNGMEAAVGNQEVILDGKFGAFRTFSKAQSL